ncbi:MAG: hypothetical protein HY749_21330 [Gammaproteobacteria bacterium]|nr:hypothetical protein [Gammaproteobacteria bacterium]
MRYRLDQVPSAATPYPDAHYVTFTVWLTLVIAIVLLIVAARAGQRWLVLWSGLTIVACGVYFLYA